MSTRVSETILFVGKAISAIRESKTPTNEDAIRSISTTFLNNFVELFQQQMYKDIAFEVVFQDVKKHVSEIMWKTIVMDCDIKRHLKVWLPTTYSPVVGLQQVLWRTLRLGIQRLLSLGKGRILCIVS